MPGKDKVKLERESENSYSPDRRLAFLSHPHQKWRGRNEARKSPIYPGIHFYTHSESFAILLLRFSVRSRFVPEEMDI